MISRVLTAATLAAATLIAADVSTSFADSRYSSEPMGHGSPLAFAGAVVPVAPTPVPSSQRPPSSLTDPSLPPKATPTAAPLPSRQKSTPLQPPAIPPIVPASAKSLFTGDFDTGDFSQWTTCQSVILNADCAGYNAKHYSMEIVPGRDGGSAAKFIVRPGDVPDFGGGERSEVAAHGPETSTREGDERWYRFSMRFDENFPAPTDGSWFIVMQWHSGDGSPPLALNVSPDLTVDIGGDGVEHPEKTLGPVRRGEWVDYVMHVKFSQSSGEGFVEAWENGVQTVQRYNRATMSSDENYLKMGIYRGNDDDTTAAVTFDEFEVSAP